MSFGRVWTWWRGVSFCFDLALVMGLLLAVWVLFKFGTGSNPAGWLTTLLLFGALILGCVGVIMFFVIAECYRSGEEHSVRGSHLLGALVSIMLTGGTMGITIWIGKALAWWINFLIPVVVGVAMLRLRVLLENPVMKSTRLFGLWLRSEPIPGIIARRRPERSGQHDD